MSDEDGPKLTVISEQTQAEIDRDWALRGVTWATREFVSNLLRVMRGAGRPSILMSQMFELTKTLVDAHDKATAWEVNEAFEAVLYDALPDWSWDDDNRGDLHTVMKGALQLIASNLLGQSTHQVAGRHEMYDGINGIQRRREEERRKREEEHQAYLRSLRPQSKPRKVAKRKQAATKVAPNRTLPPLEVEPDPDPSLLTTAEIVRINAKRLRDGREPI